MSDIIDKISYNQYKNQDYSTHPNYIADKTDNCNFNYDDNYNQENNLIV